MTGERVTATPEAREAIQRLKREVGPIMFYQPGGCFDGSLPICFKLVEFIIGENDIFLGKVDGTPVYIDSRQYEEWKNTQLVLDVAPGESVGFSIAAGDNLHFVTKSNFMKADFVIR